MVHSKYMKHGIFTYFVAQNCGCILSAISSYTWAFSVHPSAQGSFVTEIFLLIYMAKLLTSCSFDMFDIKRTSKWSVAVLISIIYRAAYSSFPSEKEVTSSCPKSNTNAQPYIVSHKDEHQRIGHDYLNKMQDSL